MFDNGNYHFANQTVCYLKSATIETIVFKRLSRSICFLSITHTSEGSITQKGDERVTAYKQFKELCEQKKVTPYRVAVSTGIAQTTFKDWKKGEYTPKIDKLCKIANYFEVPVTVFIEGYDG